jgi:hypothetical protein
MVSSVPGSLLFMYNRKPHVFSVSHMDFDQGFQDFKVIFRGLQVPLPHVLLGGVSVRICDGDKGVIMCPGGFSYTAPTGKTVLA